jgi:hypothetical protein
MLFHAFSLEERWQWPVTASSEARGLVAKTGCNLGNASRCAARASAVISRSLASQPQQSTWRSIW